MKVKDLIKLLKEFDQEKEVHYSPWGEGIDLRISNVSSGLHYPTYEEVVFIVEQDINY